MTANEVFGNYGNIRVGNVLILTRVQKNHAGENPAASGREEVSKTVQYLYRSSIACTGTGAEIFAALDYDEGEDSMATKRDHDNGLAYKGYITSALASTDCECSFRQLGPTETSA